MIRNRNQKPKNHESSDRLFTQHFDIHKDENELILKPINKSTNDETCYSFLEVNCFFPQITLSNVAFVGLV